MIRQHKQLIIKDDDIEENWQHSDNEGVQVTPVRTNSNGWSDEEEEEEEEWKIEEATLSHWELSVPLLPHTPWDDHLGNVHSVNDANFCNYNNNNNNNNNNDNSNSNTTCDNTFNSNNSANNLYNNNDSNLDTTNNNSNNYNNNTINSNNNENNNFGPLSYEIDWAALLATNRIRNDNTDNNKDNGRGNSNNSNNNSNINYNINNNQNFSSNNTFRFSSIRNIVDDIINSDNDNQTLQITTNSKGNSTEQIEENESKKSQDILKSVSNFIQNCAPLYERILACESVDVEEIIQLLSKNNILCSRKVLKQFLDEQGVLYTDIQTNNENDIVNNTTTNNQNNNKQQESNDISVDIHNLQQEFSTQLRQFQGIFSKISNVVKYQASLPDTICRLQEQLTQHQQRNTKLAYEQALAHTALMKQQQMCLQLNSDLNSAHKQLQKERQTAAEYERYSSKLKIQLEEKEKEIVRLLHENRMLNAENLSEFSYSELEKFEKKHQQIYSKIQLAKNERQAQELRLLEREKEQMQEKTLCKICFDNKRNIVLMPCSHFCLCDKCAQLTSLCPLCRAHILQKITTYDG